LEDGWKASGDFMSAACADARPMTTGQAGVRKVADDARRNRLVSKVAGYLKKIVPEPVLKRTFEYWHITRKSAAGSQRA
jgi:catalase